ncbi:class I SAM-dependent methyltransferase [Marichromatium sp. AB32]|nr:class I SAM-dependent methyltransferase [Marichromatium sp. AB32]
MIVNGVNFNITNAELFKHSVEGIQKSIATPKSFFCSDNIISWNRNLSFMTDSSFMQLVQRHATSDIEMAIIWRTYVLCYFARLATHLPGDFLEVGAYQGNTANVIADWIDIESSDKKYWLYDAFEHTGIEANHALPGHSPELFEEVKKRFRNYKSIHVIKGHVPNSFSQGFPESIAFAHIDLNQAPAEVATLERVLPILTPGGIIVLDDYGWHGYRAQKEAEDPLLARFGLSALELPTGQGLVIKPL